MSMKVSAPDGVKVRPFSPPTAPGFNRGEGRDQQEDTGIREGTPRNTPITAEARTDAGHSFTLFFCC